jgi:hypothetical protein
VQYIAHDLAGEPLHSEAQPPISIANAVASFAKCSMCLKLNSGEMSIELARVRQPEHSMRVTSRTHSFGVWTCGSKSSKCDSVMNAVG